MFLEALTKLRKATISFVKSVCPSVHTERLGSYRESSRFVKIWRK